MAVPNDVLAKQAGTRIVGGSGLGVPGVVLAEIVLVLLLAR
jgi:hypothetical protein